ncbi:hypothetical protein FRC03_003804 [Tulasnella sp. 419]|nr:hypothetical protein FRC03_003804 [Tulasnella sp. 419]
MKLSAGLAALAALLTTKGVSAVAEWGQCAGSGWSSACDTGLVCVYVNDYYSQCLKPSTSSLTIVSPSASSSSSKTSTSTSSSATPSSTARVKFKYFGVNESCAEFGQDVSWVPTTHGPPPTVLISSSERDSTPSELLSLWNVSAQQQLA